MDQIYKAPDIRKQKLEEAEEFINEKRTKRLIMAAKHQQTVLDKALKLHDKDVERFTKQSIAVEKAMDKLEEQINKLDSRLNKLLDLHNGLVNIEAVIEENKT